MTALDLALADDQRPVVWMRYGPVYGNPHAAHAFVDGKQLCKIGHPLADKATSETAPHEVECTPHGQPYGRGCAHCLKLTGYR
jgi:hypothetical protein